MKNLLFLLIIGVCFSALHFCKSPSNANTTGMADTAHNSKTSLDWDGVYRGVLPCANCEGIETTIHLVKDAHYTVRAKYLGKSDSIYERSGKFEWNDQGNTIRFDEGSDKATIFFVGENALTQFDNDGKRITGEMADRYILRKSPNDIVEKYWKLTDLRGKPVQADITYIKEPHIIFKQQENRIIGHGGCNSISGSYELKEGNRIVISNVI